MSAAHPFRTVSIRVLCPSARLEVEGIQVTPHALDSTDSFALYRSLVSLPLSDPDHLKETHGPELREQLTAAWVKVHPDHNKSKDLTTPRTDSLNTGGHVHAM